MNTSTLPAAFSPASAVQGATQQLPLKDIHLPAPVSDWPPAIGWWLLLLIGIILITAIAVGITRYIKQRRYRKAALKELALIETDFLNASSQNVPVLAAQLNQLLRRTAMHAGSRPQVASLHGDAWLSFLLTQCPSSSRTTAQHLWHAAYSDQAQLDPEQAIAFVRHWIKKHKRLKTANHHAKDQATFAQQSFTTGRLP